MPNAPLQFRVDVSGARQGEQDIVALTRAVHGLLEQMLDASRATMAAVQAQEAMSRAAQAERERLQQAQAASRAAREAAQAEKQAAREAAQAAKQALEERTRDLQRQMAYQIEAGKRYEAEEKERQRQLTALWKQGARERYEAATEGARLLKQAQDAANRTQDQAARLGARTNTQMARTAAAHQSGGGGGGNGNLAGALEGTVGMVNSLIGGVLGTLANVVRSVAGAVIGLAEQIVGTLVGALQAAASWIERTTLALTAMGAAVTAVGVAYDKFRDDQLQVLGTLLRSRDAAKDLFGWIERMSDTTPFRTTELAQAATQLTALGLDAKQYLGIVTDAAYATRVPLEQVIRLLAEAKGGMFLARSGAAMGITRRDIAQSGVIMRNEETVANRNQVLPAITGILQRRFGGAAANADVGSAIETTLVSRFQRLAGAITQPLYESLKRAGQSLNRILSGALANPALINALRVPFELLGKAIEWAAGQLPKLAAWLQGVLTQQNVVNFLSQVWGWIVALGQQVQAFVAAATGGQGLAGVWTAFQNAAGKAIDFVWKAWNILLLSIQWLSANAPALFKVVADGVGQITAAVKELVGVGRDLVGVFQSLGLGGGGQQTTQAGMGGGFLGGLKAVFGFLGGAGVGGRGGPRGSRMEYEGTTVTHPDGRVENYDAQGRRSADVSGTRGSELMTGGPRADAQGRYPWDALQQSFGGLWQQIQGVARGPGIGSLLGDQQQAAQQAQGTINRALGTGKKPGKPKAPTIAPGMMLAGGFQGSGGEAARGEATVGPDLATREAMMQAGVAEAEAAAEAANAVGPFATRLEQAQAAARKAVQTIGPVVASLREKQQNLLIEMGGLDQNTELYWQKRAEFYQTEKQAQDATRSALLAQGTAAKEAVQQSRATIDAQAQVVQARAETIGKLDPAAGRAYKLKNLVPALKARISALGQAVPGESPEEALRRQAEQEQARGELTQTVLEGGGFGGNALGGTLGGTISLVDTKRLGDMGGDINKQLQDAAESAFPGARSAMLRRTLTPLLQNFRRLLGPQLQAMLKDEQQQREQARKALAGDTDVSGDYQQGKAALSDVQKRMGMLGTLAGPDLAAAQAQGREMGAGFGGTAAAGKSTRAGGATVNIGSINVAPGAAYEETKRAILEAVADMLDAKFRGAYAGPSPAF